MFDNIGGKIKGVAKFITWVGIIASAITFIIMVISGSDDSIALGFVILIVGCLGSWLSSLTLYGFGQLVENSYIIIAKLHNIKTNVNNINENTEINHCDIQAKTNIYVEKSFDQLINELNLSEKQKSNIEELIEWEIDGLISIDDCRNRISKILSDKPSELVNALINKI